MATTLTYATQLKLNQYLGQVGIAPDWDADSPPTGLTYESVGTGDNSTNTFYLNSKFVISDTYTFYYGTATALTAATALTETTDYTLAKDQGVVTLTATGITTIGTDTIFADYKYNTLSVSDDIITAALTRAQNKIEQFTQTVFAVGTDATPTYGQNNQELHSGKGQYDRKYYTNNYPVPIITDTLNGALTSTATSVVVDSTTGFASTGTVCVNTEQFSYTGKTATAFTGVTRGANSSTAATHDDEATVTRHIVEYSTTESGSTPTFETQEYLADYSIDGDSGRVKLLNFDSLNSALLSNKFPIEDLPDRVRLTYPYGYNTIPEEIERVTLMLATKELRSQTINSALISGRDEYKPSLVNVDDDEINKILTYYRSQQSTAV
jgi:hypothetical protein